MNASRRAVTTLRLTYQVLSPCFLGGADQQAELLLHLLNP